LDSLGVPFCCSWYRGTGHLRRDFTGKVPEEKIEDSILQEDPPDYVDEEDSLGCGQIHYGPEAGSQFEEATTFIGKLKYFCQNNFVSLSLWERDALESSSWLQENNSAIIGIDKGDLEKNPLVGEVLTLTDVGIFPLVKPTR
jgi:hypothetical protein